MQSGKLKKARQITVELYGFIEILEAYTSRYKYEEGMDNVLLISKHIETLANELYYEIEAWKTLQNSD